MTGKKLLEAMNQIDDAYVEEYAGLTAKIAAVFRGFRRYQKVLAASIALVILLSFAVTVTVCNMSETAASSSVSNSMQLEPPSIKDYAEYQHLIAKSRFTSRFVNYLAISRLGKFQAFYYASGEFNNYHYIVQDENGQSISFYICHTPSQTSFPKITTLPEGMTSMAYLGHIIPGSYYYERGNCQYVYVDSELTSIVWQEGGTSYSIRCAFKKYPTEDIGHSIVAKLLSMSDTEALAAQEALQADIHDYLNQRVLRKQLQMALPTVLLLLLVTVLVAVDLSISKRFRKANGTKRPLSKRRYLYWMLILLVLILAVCGFVDAYVLQPISVTTLYPVRIMCPTGLQMLQVQEGMTLSEVIDIMGSPQKWYGNDNYPLWSTFFGGSVIVKFADYKVEALEYLPLQSSNGWILPGILMIFGLLGFVLYRIRFHKEKSSKRRCIVWMAVVLVVVFVALCVIDAFLLPYYDYYRFFTNSRVRIFHPVVFDLGKIDEETTNKEAKEILGVTSRSYEVEAKKYVRNVAAEWDLPFGAVYRRTTEGERRIVPFASLLGLVVPGVMLITFLTELGIYGYLFYGDALGTLLGKRQKSKKTGGPAKE